MQIVSVPPSNNVIFSDDFNGTTLQSGWTVKAPTFTPNGSGLLVPSGDNNAEIARLLPSNFSSIVAELTVTNIPNDSFGGVGPMFYFTSALSNANSFVYYAMIESGRQKINMNDGEGNSFSGTYPLKITSVLSPTGIKTYINGVLVNTYSIANKIAYGIGIYQNVGNAATRIDKIEARKAL